MQVDIYFSIVSTDNAEIVIKATATLSGQYVPADFNHDIEDDRECLVDEIEFIDNDGNNFEPSSKLVNIVHEHVYKHDNKIFRKAEKGIDDIFIDDFKSILDYETLMF